MFYLHSLLADVAPVTPNWNLSVGLTMIICNLIAFAIGKFALESPNAPPKLPSETASSMGLPGIIASASLGHILGAGAILGLARLGVL